MSLLHELKAIWDKSTGVSAPPPFNVRALTMKPRPYQIQGIQFLREHKRAMLTDAPGLGKTFQACEAAVKPVIVSCPLFLVDQWKEFVEEQYPCDTVVTAAHGDFLTRHKAIQRFLSERADWLIINHDMWRKFYVDQANTLIIDEFHDFRNREADRSRKLFTAAQHVERVYGLTATPVYKDTSNLWHLLHILDPKAYTSYWRFINQYCVTSDYGFGTKILGTKNKAYLDRALAECALGRTYKQVGMFLPDKIDKDVRLPLDEKTRNAYNQLRDFYKIELEGYDTKRFFNAGAVLHELRKLTVTPAKIDAIKRIVDDTPRNRTTDNPNGAPIVVFGWYKETTRLLAEALRGVEITGDVKPEERRVLARTGGVAKSRVRVATIESLSTGIDLSDARTVIFAEQSYVPGQQYQALSRVMRHRTSSNDTDPIVAYWIRHAQTVDDVVHKTVRSRVKHNALDVLKEALE